MEKNTIISHINYAAPILSLSLIAFLLVFKLFRKIRTYFKVLVNCWFCNVNCKIPFELYNRWECPHCGQYNGFTEDGDYNRDISAQRESKPDSYNIGGPTKPLYFSLINKKPENGLCEHCNEKQAHKIEKISQFEPENENNFDEELTEFRKTLEDIYKPCIACQNNIVKILTEKKKIILGSKLASLPRERNFFDIGLEKYISPKVQNNRKILKNTFSIVLFTFSCINFMNITHKVNLNSKNINIAQSIPIGIITHFVALTRVMTNIFLDLFQMKLIEKSILYIKTIATLVSYTLGININFFHTRLSVDFESEIPFVAICLTLGLILLSKFKNNQYLMLLVLWSINEIPIKGFFNEIYAVDIIKLLTSLAIIGFSIPRRDKSENAKYCLETTAESFHRIYSEDYLSQSNNNRNVSTKLSSSSSSNFTNKNISLNTTISNGSFADKSLGSDIFRNTITSSVYALNNSPESAFKKYHFDDTSSQILNRSHIITSPTNINQNSSCKLFLSNMELNRVPQQPHSPSYSLHSMTMNRNSDHFNNIKASSANNFNGIQYSSPLSPPITSCSSEIFRRQNIISPSRFNNNTFTTNNSYQQVYSAPQSWVSGGYFNNQKQAKDIPFNKSCYMNNLTSITEHESRASSQSSGFESQEGSARNCDNENYSRESSFCRDIDRWSVCSVDPTFVPQDFKSYSQQSIISGTAACISPPPLVQYMAAPSLILSNHNMNLAPSSPRSQSIQSLYVDNNKNNNCPINYVGGGGLTSSEPELNQKINSSKCVKNMFEFNSLYHVLPPIQRGSLLKKWREQTST